MLTTVVFDLDDTLYDEIDYCESGFKAVAGWVADKYDIGRERVFEAICAEFNTENRGRVFNAALEKVKIEYDQQLIAALVKIYREHKPEIALPDESREVLEKLSKKYTLALLTDGFLPAQQLKVRSLGIEKFFKAIIYTEEIGRDFWKPSPVGFQNLVKTLSEKPQNCVYVADNEEKDFIAPNSLGFKTIRVLRPAGIHKTVAENQAAKPAHIIYPIRGLPNLLKKLE